MRACLDRQLLCSVATEPASAGTADLYEALSEVAREQLATRWVATQHADSKEKARRVYYLSMEFLIGRTLNNALSALDLRESAAAAFAKASGPSLDQV
ncbi:glycogen phosphorylase, partial [bacterium]|nr:glycogen phosphorylase [bacterium]